MLPIDALVVGAAIEETPHLLSLLFRRRLKPLQGLDNEDASPSATSAASARTLL
jgi:hypothetical protein